MKKLVLLLILAGIIAVPMFAADKGFKLGGMAGTPTAITGGYRFSDKMEVNALVGVGFGYYGYAAITVGANLLFTVYTFDIDGHQLPLSLGPQVVAAFGLNDYYDVFGLDGVLDIRLEYTFDNIPLNLFVETGFGIGYESWKWDFFGSDYSDSRVGFAWSGSVGARYVF